MNFTTQVVISRPRPHVLELISNPDNLTVWQPGLKSVELLAGKKNQIGARSRITVEFRGLRIEMIETMVANEPPELFSSIYAAKGVKNLVENRFFAEGPGSTRWVIANNFKFSGLMSVIGVFLQDSISQQNRESMQRFKEFAESS